MGKLHDISASENKPSRQSVSVTRNLQMSEQRNISDMLNSIRKSDTKKRVRKGHQIVLKTIGPREELQETTGNQTKMQNITRISQ